MVGTPTIAISIRERGSGHSLPTTPSNFASSITSFLTMNMVEYDGVVKALIRFTRDIMAYGMSVNPKAAYP